MILFHLPTWGLVGLAFVCLQEELASAHSFRNIQKDHYVIKKIQEAYVKGIMF